MLDVEHFFLLEIGLVFGDGFRLCLDIFIIILDGVWFIV